MKNNMKDLDFEQTVVFDSVKEFEFTRKAAHKFRQIVSLENFEDADADIIFNYLYKEMELVSFADFLKRYIYERACLEEPYNEVTMEIYREIIIESFKETCTPKSMTPTSTKFPALVNNWLNQASVKRETVFLLGFGLKMTTRDVTDFLTKVVKEQDFDFNDANEIIYWFCYEKQLGYYKAEEYKKIYQEIETGNESLSDEKRIYIDTEEDLISYLKYIKSKSSCKEKNISYQYFLNLLDETKEIIASMYQKDEEEKKRGRIWEKSDITPSDIEKVICNGIPINSMGNLKKMSASILAKHFSQKRFSRQRITNILNNKFPVERFDLLTLEFFIVSQKKQEEDSYVRYKYFLERAQEILKECGMGELYIVNPYECFLLMCLLTDCPLAVFSEIWEMSYEENE